MLNWQWGLRLMLCPAANTCKYVCCFFSFFILSLSYVSLCITRPTQYNCSLLFHLLKHAGFSRWSTPPNTSMKWSGLFFSAYLIILSYVLQVRVSSVTIYAIHGQLQRQRQVRSRKSKFQVYQFAPFPMFTLYYNRRCFLFGKIFTYQLRHKFRTFFCYIYEFVLF